MNPLTFTPRLKKVMSVAEKIAVNNNHNYLAPEHVLLALISEEGGMVPELLRTCHYDPNTMYNQLQEAATRSWSITPKTTVDFKAASYTLRSIADILDKADI